MKGRLGRPTTKARARQKTTLGILASAQLKTRLTEEAEKAGRSLSAEAEFRLERSFQQQDLLGEVLSLTYGPKLAELVAMVASAMRAAGSAAALSGEHSWDAVDRWTEIPYAFNEAFVAAVTVLEGRRPAGGSDWPDTLLSAPVPEPQRKPGELGEKLARDVLRSGPPAKWSEPDPAIAASWDNALKNAAKTRKARSAS
jgi:hypothetical protein